MLTSLTNCMAEDLTNRGLVSNPDCHRIMDRHAEDRRRYGEKLMHQKKKQERHLREKLEERALKKQKFASVLRRKELKRLQKKQGFSEISSKIAHLNVLMEQGLENDKQA